MGREHKKKEKKNWRNVQPAIENAILNWGVLGRWEHLPLHHGLGKVGSEAFQKVGKTRDSEQKVNLVPIPDGYLDQGIMVFVVPS